VLLLLDRNEHDPYAKIAIIKDVVSHTASFAQLKVFSVTGSKGEPGTSYQGTRKSGAFYLNPAGTYIYHLIVEGESGNNKMVMTPKTDMQGLYQGQCDFLK
jgi:hypothetical protein